MKESINKISPEVLVEEAIKHGRNLKTFTRVKDGSVRYELEDLGKTEIVFNNKTIITPIWKLILISIVVTLLVNFLI